MDMETIYRLYFRDVYLFLQVYRNRLQKLKQELPAHKSAAPKKREPER